ncbi:MAG: NUDIX hydrolase [Candidatus Uhrbacteria bacterium GW2011_GWE2_45_35]|uniref:NUDIX hydrolase n=2 Tax=Candidatus Uhriibacteriota TaxID=1752732 RepID=A0A0G1JJ29_9BACT|nr:MAG: NUDIX hydrolase [Candidatus Uhrbacteria bacterium GW2011_GWF2_44_350]KKU08645.1 MAG: NUDIX hydrolase [Candidatus Uhrbacteria bacterium GW2011_GWE2_45_35]HBR80296.1 hypothetical protein [Candidatus Uhrbacteria bacterium]HCU31598.1 hypothetical protein [Candidatus Uhrbacteria bacterium]
MLLRLEFPTTGSCFVLITPNLYGLVEVIDNLGRVGTGSYGFDPRRVHHAKIRDRQARRSSKTAAGFGFFDRDDNIQVIFMTQQTVNDHLIADIPVKALIRQNGCVLLVKEPDGQFALPGGRMCVGELPREALRREVLEEIGLEVKVEDLFDCAVFTSKSGMHHFVVIFTAQLLENIGSVQLDKTEIVAVEWVPLSQLFSLPLRNEYRSVLSRLVSK